MGRRGLLRNIPLPPKPMGNIVKKPTTTLKEQTISPTTGTKDSQAPTVNLPEKPKTKNREPIYINTVKCEK